MWRECQHTLITTLSAGEPAPLPTLFTVRSLIANPSTCDATVSSILETLNTLLSLPHHNHHHHILSLLSTLFFSHPHLSQLIFASVFSFFYSTASDAASSYRFEAAVAALCLLLSIADADSTLCSAIESIDDGLLIALCFRPCIRVRIWILINAPRLRIRTNLLVTVFLGFTKDPYPEVRRAALDGLSKASEDGDTVDDCGIVEGCLLRAIELLGDAENDVRAAAIRVVSRWGQMLMATKNESDYKDCSDFLFIQLCSMVRDMSLSVRLEAFDAIGRIRVISDDVLLLTLSKRVQGTVIEKKILHLSSGKQYEVPTSSVAGAFLHGLEDEFSEVRRASCKSMQTVTSICSRFASEAATLLMDVMNDDTVMVRLEALETVRRMVLSTHLKLQQEHVQALVATIADNSLQIRIGATEVLGLLKFPTIKLFKLYVESLLRNLDLYPQDEARTLHALFKIGQNHGKFAFCIIENACDQIMHSGGKLAFDKPEMIGLVVLAISASVSVEAPFSHVLQSIFSAAAVFLGRISYALRELMDQNTLYAYLSQSCKSSLLSTFKDEDHFSSSTNGMDVDNSCIRQTSSVESSQLEADDQASGIRSKFRAGALLSTNCQKGMLVEVTQSVKLILANTKSSWQLAKSSCTSEALKVLRCCREEMDIIEAATVESSSILAFGLQYVRVVKLLVKLWDHVMFPGKHFRGMGYLDLLLQKLDKCIVHLRYRFTGFSIEDELHILEFVLLNYVLRLSRVQTCCKTLKKLSTTISHVANLCQTVSAMPSEFVNELDKLSSEDCATRVGFFLGSPLFKKMFNLFDPRDIMLSESIKHIKADLEFPGSETDLAFSFMSGFPVGVPCEIALYNVSSEHKLWLNMKVDKGLSQFLFLDLDQFGGDEEVKKFVYNAPFYKTPNAVAFALTVSIGIECPSEDLKLSKCHVGPRNQLSYLCEEKEIEFFMVDKM